ncbi:medium-chain acyl-CoA ligase ACSF2, mitochondrial isoform X1 [Bombus terrestris]|uniref:Medium-chain acyl-CoA ligase ACSF2, mitochondrial n=1 Tax=Bombus terrestris TaxID=30195 RepID=A0A9B0F5Q1_BOMTE|nr:medium-chain acyl-CoA ligase ACSF2, mitochondrial isoform X1 [Bombus terrestris]
MFRFCITRNSFFFSATNYRVYYRNVANVKHSLLVNPRSSWKLCNMSSQRLFHENQDKPAHMLQHGSVPLIDEPIGKLIGTAAERWPDRECVVSLHQNIRLTFSDVIQRADRLAAGLMKLGMKRGDRLGLWGPNDVEWLITYMCASRAGFILVAINPNYQMDELIHCIQKVGVKAVISPDNFKTQDYPRMLLQAQQMCPTLEHIIIYSKDHVTGTRRFIDVEELATRIETQWVAAEQGQISCHDGSNIQFTSGTTGRPKATLISHRSVMNNSKQAAVKAELTVDHKVCLNVPFFHVFGIIKGLMCMLHAGITLVLPARSFNPVKSLEAIVREKCNVVYGTPTMWINLLDVQQRFQPPPITLACGVTGGAPASPELFKKIRKCFNFDNMKTIYGLTETTAVIFQTLPNENNELTENTVGHLADHVEAMIVDENGNTVPFGTPGELWIRGYCTMMKYWNDKEATEKTLTKDGWLMTGDQFVLRSDGYGQIVGRLKDMIIRGGENIFPKEVEDVLMTHPLVAEAQVIGAYDEVYGEEVCACVRLQEGASLRKEELREYCKGRMAHFKIPRYIEFVTEYSKTASGKIQKYKLKQQMESKRVIPTNSGENITVSFGKNEKKN